MNALQIATKIQKLTVYIQKLQERLRNNEMTPEKRSFFESDLRKTTKALENLRK